MKSRVINHVRSNTIAYLALFVALSGTAYAADKIGPRDIKKGAVKSKQIGNDQVRSKDIKDDKGVKSADVKDGSLKGTDIDESSLGTVPRATDAETALRADQALSLEGFDPSELLAADRILYGRGSSEADEALLFRWPGTGVEVRTHDVDAGDAIFEIRLHNTNPPGGPSFYVVDVGSSAGLLSPGASQKHGGLIGEELLLVENNGSLGRMMRLSCFANVIAGGDDGFLQCMGVTAGAP